MITAYYRQDGKIEARQIAAADPLPHDLCWLDLHTPDDEERAAVSRALNIDVPTRADTEEIEASSRLYVDNGVIYLTTAVLVGTDTSDHEMADLTLIVTKQHLVILHFSEPKSVAIFAARARRDPSLVANPNNAVLAFMDALADRTADMLELTGRRVDALSRQIFKRPAARAHGTARLMRRHNDNSGPSEQLYGSSLKEILHGVGGTGDILHLSYHSINGMIRMSAFLAQSLVEHLSPEQMTLMRTLQGDLRSLHDHSQFLIQETTFLLDATLGHINNEQNDIFRLLSMASVVLMPSNLLAGIYGMNFSSIPGLHGEASVWIVIGMMVLSIVTALVYFKRRGWW
ncbi:MAG: CorA family divalent cation transporter [Alphaproteobacteria bacterium]